MSWRDRLARLRDRLSLTVRYPRAAQIFTHLTPQERLTLVRLAAVAPNGAAVEIGSYLGGSASFLCEGLRRRIVSTRLYCVDTWMNEGMSEGSRDTYEEFRENTAPYEDLVVPLRGKSVEIARQFDQPIGLLFVDGDHAYEAVSQDLNSWLPKVVSGGLVILHDAGWAPGVRQAIEEHVKPVARSQTTLPNMYWAEVEATS